MKIFALPPFGTSQDILSISAITRLVIESESAHFWTNDWVHG